MSKMIKVFKTAQLFFNGEPVPPLDLSSFLEPEPMPPLTISLTMISTSTLERLEADLELARYQRDLARDRAAKQAREIGHLQDTVNNYAARINRAEAEPPAMIAHLHKLEKDARFTGRGLYSKGIRAAIAELERGAHK